MTAIATPTPRLNQRLEVAIGDRGAAQYFSRLVEETGDTLRISIPEMEGDVLSLREGDLLRMWFTGSSSYWCLNSIVRGTFNRDGETLVEVDRRGEVHRAQRRNHVRVDVSLLLHAHVELRADAGAGGAEGDRLVGSRISAVTRDISGGGVSFRCPVELRDRDRLSMVFYLPEQAGEIASRGRVVHVRPDEKEGWWNVACTFERMAITDRERIIRFLFFRQRELAGRRKVGVR